MEFDSSVWPLLSTPSYRTNALFSGASLESDLESTEPGEGTDPDGGAELTGGEDTVTSTMDVSNLHSLKRFNNLHQLIKQITQSFWQ